MTHYAILTDLNKCVGCLACSISCKVVNNVPIGSYWNKVLRIGPNPRQEGGQWPDVYTYFLTVQCQHCKNPACVQVCPTTAMTQRDDGTVFVDQSKCVGCRYCEWACAYGAPQFNAEAGHMTKCDLCYDYRQSGQDPACVAACPSRALEWGPIDALRAAHGDEAGIAPLPDPAITHPRLVIKPHRDAQKWDQADGHIANPKEI